MSQNSPIAALRLPQKPKIPPLQPLLRRKPLNLYQTPRLSDKTEASTWTSGMISPQWEAVHREVGRTLRAKIPPAHNRGRRKLGQIEGVYRAPPSWMKKNSSKRKGMQVSASLQPVLMQGRHQPTISLSSLGSATCTSKSAGDALSDLLNLDPGNRVQYIRKPQAQSSVPQQTDKSGKDSKVMEIQPVLNLRTVSTNELLRSDSDEVDVPFHRPRRPKASPPPSFLPYLPHIREEDTLVSSRLQSLQATDRKADKSPISAMKTLKSDYSWATSAVLSDTKSLLKDQMEVRKVSKRLIDV